MSDPAKSDLGSRLAWALATLIPAALGLGLYDQGFDLDADGLWLLGARTWTRSGALYPGLAVHGGPGAFLFLLPFYGLLGQSAAAIVAAKAISTGLCAGAGFALARRFHAGSFAWAVPVATVGLGPVPLALTAFALAAWAATSGSRRWTAVSTAALATFGLGWTVAGVLLVLVVRDANWSWRLAMVGASLAALAVASAIAAGGDLAHVRIHVVGPALHSMFEATPAWMSWLHAPPVPFGTLHTGESLDPLFAGHAAWHRVASAVQLLLPWVVAFVAWRTRWWHQRPPRPLLLVLLPTTIGLIFTSATRGTAALTAVWLGAGMLSMMRPRGAAWGLTVAMLLAGFGPRLAEVSWLSSHADRPGLRAWDRPHAQVKVATARIDQWEAVLDALDERGAGSILIWPNRPGLYALLDLDLPSRQATLMRRDQVDVEAVLGDLETAEPITAMLVIDDTRATFRIREYWPEVWEYLRARYRVVGNVTAVPDPVRVLERIAGGAGATAQLPLPEQLADVELSISNEAGPAMRKGFTVGQTVRTGASDLRGISVRWRTAGRPVEVPGRVRVWQRRGDEYDALLEFLDVQLIIPRDGYRSFLRFEEPIFNTAHKDLAITLEVLENTTDEIRLLWHRHDERRLGVDLYPEGSALVNRRPVPADLYFFSY